MKWPALKSLVLALLSLSISLIAHGNAVGLPSSTELQALLEREHQLKQATKSAGDAAILNLIEFYLEQPQPNEQQIYPTGDRYRDLFAAHCWRQQLSATEQSLATHRTAYQVIDDILVRERFDDFALMPRRLDLYADDSDAIQMRWRERWGPAADDPHFLANQSWQQSMPELSNIPLASVNDIANAINQAEQLSVAHPTRPEPLAYMAQLSQMQGNAQAALNYADQALQRSPIHYLANSIKAAVEVTKYNRGHRCDLEVVWQRLIQADEANIESVLVLQSLAEFYNQSPVPHRLHEFDALLAIRDDHDSAFSNPNLADTIKKVGGRPWLTADELARVQKFRATIQQALNKQ